MNFDANLNANLDRRHGAAPAGLSDEAKARLRLCAELAGVMLATVLLAVALAVTVKVICWQSSQSGGSAAASAGWACGAARVIDAVASSVGELVARPMEGPAIARMRGPASRCRTA